MLTMTLTYQLLTGQMFHYNHAAPVPEVRNNKFVPRMTALTRLITIFKRLTQPIILTHEVCQLLFKTAAWSSFSKIIPAHWKGLTTPSLNKLAANHWILPLLSHGVAGLVLNWEKSPHTDFFLTFRPHYFIQITTHGLLLSSANWVQAS